jgi:hypothetical protein
MSIHIRHITSLLQPPPLLNPNGSSKPTTLSQSALLTPDSETGNGAGISSDMPMYRSDETVNEV